MQTFPFPDTTPTVKVHHAVLSQLGRVAPRGRLLIQAERKHQSDRPPSRRPLRRSCERPQNIAWLAWAQRMMGICLLIATLWALAILPCKAQNLNWEGQTGAFVTPFAYTIPSPARGIGHPVASFHYLNGGDVLGGFYEASGTVGFLRRFEAGYTGAMNSHGDTPGLSPLFEGEFNIYHVKANLLKEDSWASPYVPAISVGFVGRTQVRRVGGVLDSKETDNEEGYVVATKTITSKYTPPILVNAGFKVTNASVLGIAGNAPAWQGLVFGAAGIVVPGPLKSKVVFGTEVLQEPHHVEGLPGAVIPTTLTYFARVVPHAEMPLNVDFGVAQVANRIMPGVELKARSQFATGISYRF